MRVQKLELLRIAIITPLGSYMTAVFSNDNVLDMQLEWSGLETYKNLNMGYDLLILPLHVKNNPFYAFHFVHSDMFQD